MEKKKIISKRKIKVAKPTGKIFKIRNQEYLVTKEGDDIRVSLKGKNIFSTKEFGRTFREWLIETRMSK